MGKMLPNGKAAEPRIFAIREDIYLSPAWASLRPVAKLIWIELRRRYKMNKKRGTNNNGEISLSQREAMAICSASINTVRSGFDSLIEVGLIKLNNKGYFGNMHASTFILTSEEYNGKPPTNEWRRYGK